MKIDLGVAAALAATACLLAPAPAPLARAKSKQFSQDFDLSRCTFSNIGSNDFMRLDPGSFLVLEGESHGELTHLEITALDATRDVGGIECRIVEEAESVDGELAEISRNFFALCNETHDVFYFGEEVDFYEDGVVVGHDGSWEAFVGGAAPGIVMPGRVLLGARYYQEVAPGIAEDRAENVATGQKVKTPAGTFTGCLKTEESSGIERGTGNKSYAPGIGLILDGSLKLTAWGG
jgi:hypothetical protein